MRTITLSEAASEMADQILALEGWSLSQFLETTVRRWHANEPRLQRGAAKA